MYPFIRNFVLPDRESGKSLASLPRQGWLGEGKSPHAGAAELSGSPRLDNILQQMETFFQSFSPSPPTPSYSWITQRFLFLTVHH